MDDDGPSVNYDPATNVYSTEINPSETQPTVAIICLFDALEVHEGANIPQLYDLLNPDALSNLLISHERKEIAGTLNLEYTAGKFHLNVSCTDGTADISLQTDVAPGDQSSLPDKSG